MGQYRKFKDIVIEDLRRDPEYAEAYLRVAFEEFEQEGDSEHLMVALRNVAEAQGRCARTGATVEEGENQSLQSSL
jgi:DNA-binding phage protein